jgi:hypothetical protein
MTTVLFDTDAMIRVGRQLRDYGRVTDPIASSMGKVPAGLPPALGDVIAECHRLDAGVRSLGGLIEGFGEFAFALGERVKAADLEGDTQAAIRLARIALFHLPLGQTVVVARIQFDELRRRWPEIYNALDDIKGAKAADDLLHGLDAAGLKNLDALAAFRRKYPHRPLPLGLRSLDETLRGASKMAKYLEGGGAIASVVARFLADLQRGDLSPGERAIRAAQQASIDFAAGRAGAAGVRLLVARIGLGAVRGPWGWALSGLGAVVSAVGADELGNKISGEVLFEPNPNDRARMRLPPEIRARIESEGRGPYNWPDINRPTPEMTHLLDLAHRQEGRINDMYSRLHSREPMDPIEYRRAAYDLVRELDARQGVAERLEALQDAKR